MQPLDGIKVVDLTRIISGPFASVLLGDMGAEVIKIEGPKGGDPLRDQGVIKNGISWYFTQFNHNKKSLTLDLRSTKGKEILTKLICQSDVVIENYRPGVMAKMGFDYPRLKELKSDIIYCGISGFGVDGPHADRPAFDFIAQAVSGLMSVNGGEESGPLRVSLPISDLVAGLYAAMGVVAALFRRERTGQGEEVHTSLVDGLISLMAYMSANFLASGILPKRTGNDHPIVAPYGLFKTADGEVAIAPSNDGVYEKFLQALDLTELKNDPNFATNDCRMANRAKINSLVEAKLKTQTRDYWVTKLNQAGVPTGTIHNLREAFQDPQVLHQEMVFEIEQPGHGRVKMTGFPMKFHQAPCKVNLPAPELGEHTDAILARLGYGEAEIKGLRERKIV